MCAIDVDAFDYQGLYRLSKWDRLRRAKRLHRAHLARGRAAARCHRGRGTRACARLCRKARLIRAVAEATIAAARKMVGRALRASAPNAGAAVRELQCRFGRTARCGTIGG